MRDARGARARRGGPGGILYAFEKGVEKTGGGKGFADVWYENRFAFEYKGRHKDLKAAYHQLLQYREALGTRRSPSSPIRTVTRYTPTSPAPSSACTASTTPRCRRPRTCAYCGRCSKPGGVEARAHRRGRVTEESARRFARIADGLRGRGVEPHDAAHFLNKVLFCLFAEDIGLLPKDLFTKVVEACVKQADLFVRYAEGLFEAMRDGGDFLAEVDTAL